MLEPFVHGGAPWVGAPDHHVFVPFAQESAGARQRSAGPNGANEGVEFPAGLVPDFRTGGYVMRLRIIQIDPLISEQHAVWLALAQLIGESFRDMLIVIRVAVWQGRYFDEFGATQ